MEIQKTSGIVLTTKTLGEADVICSILTKDHGKKQFIFKGLKKSKKRPLSAKEPGTNLSLVYYYNPEKNRCIISECSIIEAFSTIHRDLEKIYHLSFILETVERTSADGIGDIKIYHLLEGAIRTLTTTANNMHLSAFFLLHLLKLQGLFPVYGICASCSGEITGGLFLSIIDMRQLCRKCAHDYGIIGTNHGQGAFFGESISTFIFQAMQSKFLNMDYSHYGEGELKSLITTIGRFIEQYYHVKINSLDFIAPDTI